MFGAADIFDWQMGHVALGNSVALDVTAGQGAVMVLLRAAANNSAPVWVKLNAPSGGGTDIGTFRLDAGQSLELGPVENCAAVYIATDAPGQTVSYFTGWR